MKRTLLPLLLIFCFFGCKEAKKVGPEVQEDSPLYSYDIEERLEEMNIELYEPRMPKGFKIELVVQHGNLLYLSGNVPFSPSGEKYVGKVGSDLTVEEGYKAARLTGINHLSTLKWALGDLNKVEKIVKVLGMVNSAPDFTDQAQVMNGFSDLMYEVFGERGKHARSAVGMAAIPFNGACEIEMIVQVKGQIDLKNKEPENNSSTVNMKTKKLPSLISAEELLNLRKSDDLVLIDARFGKNAKEDYLQAHLNGAQHVDLNSQLSDIKENAADGGRHPLPSVARFSALLTQLGIHKNSHVVVYDLSSGAMAASRFWWMLRAAGHEKVQVLNGGLKQAEKVGFPMTSEVSQPNTVAPYAIAEWQLPMAKIAEVEQVSQQTDHMVIDVRAKERYNGETEPIDPVAGHIPGATNVPFSSNLDDDGLFLSPTELKTKYEQLLDGRSLDNVIVHCGSGVTACHTLLALDYAGFEPPKLYVGSWSEWCRNNKTIATATNE